MVIVSVLYLALVYLIFFKLKLVPFNKISKSVVVVIGVIILNIFLVGLQTLTPQSASAVIGGFVTEIAPQVGGRVVEVPVKPQQRVEAGDVLFQIDPVPYQYRVDQLKASLVETEAYVASLKDVYDAARAQTESTIAQLALSELRLEQHQRLVEAQAGSRFELERWETDVAQLTQALAAAEANENQALLNLTAEVGDTQSRLAQVIAQLESAQYDLENTTVKAPGEGVVTFVTLRPGMVVSSMRSVMAFVYTDRVGIGALFKQKALENVRVGQKAQVSFPALPGRIFEGKVRQIVDAIGEGQWAATGQLPRLDQTRMTTLYPVFVTLPEDFPEDQVRLGLAANVTVLTDDAGVVGIVATILHWISTSLAYVV
jgi:multidrug resistance efflux pump